MTDTILGAPCPSCGRDDQLQAKITIWHDLLDKYETRPAEELSALDEENPIRCTACDWRGYAEDAWKSQAQNK